MMKDRVGITVKKNDGGYNIDDFPSMDPELMASIEDSAIRNLSNFGRPPYYLCGAGCGNKYLTPEEFASHLPCVEEFLENNKDLFEDLAKIEEHEKELDKTEKKD